MKLFTQLGEIPAGLMVQIQKREAEAAAKNAPPAIKAPSVKEMRIRDLLQQRQMPAPAAPKPEGLQAALAQVAALLAAKK